MTCKHVLNFLDDYDAHRLDRLTRMRFSYHLAVCHHCRRYLDSYRKTISLSKSAFDGALAPSAESDAGKALAEVPEDLVRAILRSRVA